MKYLQSYRREIVLFIFFECVQPSGVLATVIDFKELNLNQTQVDCKLFFICKIRESIYNYKLYYTQN